MPAISGLATGNDWSKTIASLMQIERIPITTWQTRQSEFTKDKDAWKDINSRLLSLKTKSEALTDSSLWSGKKITTSDSTVVSATGDSSAISGTYDIKVKQLALAQQARSDQQLSTWTAGADSTFTLNGQLISITTGQTLQEVATAINSATYAAGEEVSATVVDNNLVLKAADTGAASTMTIADTSGTLLTDLGVILAPDTFKTELQAAQDAIFTVDGIAVTRADNTGIDDVITGVTLNINGVSAKSGAEVWPVDYASTTLTVAGNTDSIYTAIKAWVDQYNSSTDFVRTQTKVTLGSDGKVSGTGELVGNSFAVQIESRLSSIALNRYSALAGQYQSLAEIGITLGDYGTSSANKLEIDETVLRAAIDDNPQWVRKLFAKDTGAPVGYDTGIAFGIDDYLTPLTQYGGLVSDQQTSLQDSYDMLQSRIDAYETILTQREANLNKTFTNLETALAKFQNTSSWLTSQLSQLSS